MKHFMLRCWSTEHEIRCDFSTLFHDNLSRLAVAHANDVQTISWSYRLATVEGIALHDVLCLAFGSLVDACQDAIEQTPAFACLVLVLGAFRYVERSGFVVVEHVSSNVERLLNVRGYRLQLTFSDVATPESPVANFG